MFITPPQNLHELAGNSKDVLAYRSYHAFCERLGIEPMSFENHFDQRQKELEEFEVVTAARESESVEEDDNEDLEDPTEL